MFNVIAGWFVLGMFVAGVWIVVGAFLPACRQRADDRAAGYPPG